ncbi:MerR family transcriptional regulator [Streptomyces longispororuber]|uniref:MerR family transcriptional regulator n=1 Tax=Streptomyces longispororuber TaxID=68230 RepID=A0A918ZXE8_9ACTN|nr:MerR family transcriptional regulator [Streptomyces longispororuber]GHE76333.1 MerR family transcriptional regulator [Streptomyces longispororuber]
MNGDALLSIGELARRTGLSVRTIRFYSDAGLVPPADRTRAGYRRYDAGAVARLDLVRTLRELGLDLATVRKVVEREVPLSEAAAAHAEALDVQIRVLQQRRAVLTAAAGRGSTPEELGLLHRLTRLSGRERQCLVDDFLGAVLDGLRAHPAYTAVARSLTPEPPGLPDPEQVVAWAELAELFQDADFRSSVHRMAGELAADRARDDTTGLPLVLAEAVRARVGPALAAGVDPASATAAAVMAPVVAHYGRVLGHAEGRGTTADAMLRHRLADRLEHMNDPRRDQYLRLLAVVNGRPVPANLAPALDWSVRALRTTRRV